MCAGYGGEIQGNRVNRPAPVCGHESKVFHRVRLEAKPPRTTEKASKALRSKRTTVSRWLCFSANSVLDSSFVPHTAMPARLPWGNSWCPRIPQSVVSGGSAGAGLPVCEPRVRAGAALRPSRSIMSPSTAVMPVSGRSCSAQACDWSGWRVGRVQRIRSTSRHWTRIASVFEPARGHHDRCGNASCPTFLDPAMAVGRALVAGGCSGNGRDESGRRGRRLAGPVRGRFTPSLPSPAQGAGEGCFLRWVRVGRWREPRRGRAGLSAVRR